MSYQLFKTGYMFGWRKRKRIERRERKKLGREKKRGGGGRCLPSFPVCLFFLIVHFTMYSSSWIQHLYIKYHSCMKITKKNFIQIPKKYSTILRIVHARLQVLYTTLWEKIAQQPRSCNMRSMISWHKWVLDTLSDARQSYCIPAIKSYHIHFDVFGEKALAGTKIIYLPLE